MAFLFGLRAKLILAFAVVAIVALAVAAAVFVVVRRGEQEEQALDKVVAASPVIYSEFTVLQRRAESVQLLGQFVDVAAAQAEARIVMIDRRDATIVKDSAGQLDGERLVFPGDVDIEQPTLLRPYISWRPPGGTPGDELIFVAALPRQFQQFRGQPDEPYWILFAVPQGTIRGAWRDLVPGLLVATLIALPIAVVLGSLVAGYITRPLQQLTRASQRMAEGSFDVRVSIDRGDEVGRLARSFSLMSQRVGDAHAQMRALVANVSHDLKTPLTSILGFAQALRDGRARDDADARRMGGVIHDEATRLSARLNDLLYLSELESGQALLQREPVDLARLVDAVVQRIGPDIERRGLQLQTRVPAALVVDADGSKLERALENLLDNARKYTAAGGEVLVAARAEPAAAVIEIANTAPDLTDDELPRLFERFYRRRASGPDRPGSGLGLPIARDVVELHGGRIDAALRDGDLVLTVRLPRAS